MASRMAAVCAVAVAGAAVTLVGATAQAAPGCRIDYTVTSQWNTGFGAEVRVTNLGEAITGWRLDWDFSGGQRVTQGWGGEFAQSGTRVTVTNAAWNASIGSGATVTPGFNAVHSGDNPAPATFRLNGTVCTGTPGEPTTTTRPPTTAPTTTAPTTTTPGPTRPPAYPGPGHVTGDTRVHDPSMVKTPSGAYLMAHTGDNVALKTSTDRTAFRNAGQAFPSGAPWTATYTNGGRNLWAPHLSYLNGRYYLYYSASTFGSNRSAIFLATSATGASGSWRDEGLVIESRTSDNFNAIDPDLAVDDQGRWWLSFGSFWSGIKQIAINPTTGKRSDTTIRSLAGRGGGAIEAPTIVKHGAYYYLYVSFDLCCRGASSTYRVMVGRSTSVNGPFTDRNGTPMTSGGGTEILAAHGSIHGPGHQDVFTDTDSDILVYHYYTDSGAALLGINWLAYDSAGWPFVH